MILLQAGRFWSPVRAVILLLAAAASFASARDVTFFHVSDTQPDVAEAQDMILGAIRDMNELPGKAWPEELGGNVDQPRGVIITGDLTDNASEEQWKTFVSDWGLTGKDGLCKFPIYEGAGNHDGKVSTDPAGIVRRGIIERNKKRIGIGNVSANGLHYSFDWDDVHFVCLNEYGGLENDKRYEGNAAYGRKRQSYGNPAQESLQFLVEDLAAKVGDSGRPVVLYQHYGFDDFVFHPWGNDAAWWTEAQALRLWDAIEGYNVIAILGGHNGSESTFDWMGIVNQHMDDHVKYGVYHISDDKLSMSIRDSKTGGWVRSWSSPANLNASLPPELVQGPYLVRSGDASKMTVCWRLKSDEACTLKWGTDYFKFEGGSAEVESYDKRNHLYQYTIEGLKPGASVQYALKIGGKHAPGQFFTPDAEGNKVRFFIADAPSDPAGRDRLFETMYAKMLEDPACHSFIVDPGALVSAPETMDTWDRDLFSRDKSARHIRHVLARSPLISPTGADPTGRTLFPHDYQAGGGYAFDHAPVHIAVLAAPAGLAAGSPQREWLAKDLQACETSCKMLLWQRSGDSAKDSVFEKQLDSVCKEFGVDLVVSDGDKFACQERDGTTYITTSASGSGTLLAVQVQDETITCHRLDSAGNAVGEFQWKLRRSAGRGH